VLAHCEVQAAHQADERVVFQILMGPRNTHPAHIDDLAARLDNEPAHLFCGQSGREHHPARAHCDIAVPADHVNGTVVVLIAFHPVRKIGSRGPSAVSDGVRAQPVRGLAFGVVGGHPVVEAGSRQHPGDQSIKWRTIHAMTLPGTPGRRQLIESALIRGLREAPRRTMKRRLPVRSSRWKAPRRPASSPVPSARTRGADPGRSSAIPDLAGRGLRPARLRRPRSTFRRP
jgi:hypothetical protein